MIHSSVHSLRIASEIAMSLREQVSKVESVGWHEQAKFQPPEPA